MKKIKILLRRINNNNLNPMDYVIEKLVNAEHVTTFLGREVMAGDQVSREAANRWAGDRHIELTIIAPKD